MSQTQQLELRKPDYTHSIVNLVNSIQKHFGVEPAHNTLPVADAYLDKNYQNVVLMVFDGMGSENLKDILSSESFLRSHIRDTITSVFPSTTTAATVSLESGLTPCEHGWLGWSLHFNEIQDNVNLFHNTNYSGDIAADYHVAGETLSFPRITQQIEKKQTAKSHIVSPFSQNPVKNFEDFIEKVQESCQGEERNYVYAYWPEPDHTMHRTGIESDASIEWIKKINMAVKDLSKNLKNTLLIVTADHGHIDGENELITEYPKLAEMLKWLPTIEPRAISFHVKDGFHKEFQEEFNLHFQDSFLLYTKEQVLLENLFGDGQPHEKFQEFIGDFLAVAIGNVAIYNSEEEFCEFIGVHAGLTKNEMLVPLIMIECLV